jgi:hypothetical protein
MRSSHAKKSRKRLRREGGREGGREIYGMAVGDVEDEKKSRMIRWIYPEAGMSRTVWSSWRRSGDKEGGGGVT